MVRRDIHFPVELTDRYGVDGSILIHHVAYWVFKNKAEGRNYRQGTYWTYNSVRGMAAWFPFWTKDQLRRRLENLITANALIRDRFNEKGYDRTSWWTLDEELWAFYEARTQVANVPDGRGKPAKLKWQESQMDVAEKPNQYQVLTTGTDNKKRHMERPTFEMLVEEFTKKGAPDPRQIAQDFLDHYESNGWKVGRNAMKSWRHAVAKWTRNEPNKKRRGFKPGNFDPEGLDDFIRNG